MHPLLEALKPFAEMANVLKKHPSINDMVVITTEDIRRAQEVFKKYNVTPKKVTVAELEKILSEEADTIGIDTLPGGEMMVFKREVKKNGT